MQCSWPASSLSAEAATAAYVMVRTFKHVILSDENVYFYFYALIWCI
jgi:hypothetical protein